MAEQDEVFENPLLPFLDAETATKLTRQIMRRRPEWFDAEHYPERDERENEP